MIKSVNFSLRPEAGRKALGLTDSPTAVIHCSAAVLHRTDPSMFKKTMLALAVSCCAGGAAVAADVTLYGLVDYGFAYEKVSEGTEALDSETFKMNSGMNSGSRFGLKGSEHIGDNMIVGFVLENGFNADDGTLGNGGRLFGRESQMYVATPYGTVSFGRVGSLLSANGTYGLLGKFSPFVGGWGLHTGGRHFRLADHARYDNTITYVSPSYAGVQVLAQYSFQGDTKEVHKNGTAVENKSSTDRIGNLAVTYANGPLNLIAAGQWLQWSNLDRNGTPANWREKKDGYNFLVAGSYDFGVTKLYATGEYGKHMRLKASDNKTVGGMSGSFANWIQNTGYADGYSGVIGADVPLFGGTLKGEFGYRYGECVVNPANDNKMFGAAIGYSYDLSKRTTLYTAGSYAHSDLGKPHQGADTTAHAYELIGGLVHRF